MPKYDSIIPYGTPGNKVIPIKAPKYTPEQYAKNPGLGRLNLPGGQYFWNVSQEYIDNPETKRWIDQLGLELRKTGVPGPQGEMWGTTQKGEGFWDDARRIGRYYNALQSKPPGSQAPEWLDVNKLTAAYKELEARNQGPWYTWGKLANDDPVRGYVGSMNVPPVEAIPQWEQDRLAQNYQAGKDAQAQIGQQYTPPETVTPFGAWTGFGMEKDEWEALPWWKKAANAVFRTMPGQAGQMAINLGVVGGLFAGAPGAAAGLTVGGGLGWAMAAEGQRQQEIEAAGGTYERPAWVSAVMLLDELYRQSQSALGFHAQVLAALTQPEKYGSIEEIFADPKATWNAGRGLYTAFPAGFEGSNLAALIRRSKGEDDTPGRYTNVRLDTAADDVKYTPDETTPVLWALRESRRMLANGDMTADQVLEWYTQNFGFVGEATDLLAGYVLDPLDLIGVGAATGIGKFGEMTGRTALAEGFLNQPGMMPDVLTGTRYYSQLIRQMPQAEAAQLSTFSKFIGGLDKQGNMIDLATQHGPVAKLYQSVLGLTPQSRATQSLQIAVDGLQNLLTLEKANPALMVRMIEGIANLRPEDAVRAASGRMKVTIGGEATDIDMPKWFESAEAQHISGAIKDQLPVVRELLDDYNKSDPDRQILHKMAAAMGADVYDLLKDLHNGTAADANARLRQFMDALRERVAAGDREAGGLLRSLETDAAAKALSGTDLKRMADQFFGENATPFDVEHFRYNLMVTLADGVDQWAAKWFNVKPTNLVEKMIDVNKRAQSFLLLGFNPTYFMNNVVNNMVTVAWDGMLRLNSSKARQKFLRQFDMEPSRLRSGIGAAEIGDVSMGRIAERVGDKGLKGEKIGRRILEAKRSQGKMQAMTDFMKRGDKLQVFGVLSQKFEKFSSEMAMTAGMMQYWDRAWTAGKGFRKMPNELRLTLDAVQPGLADKVMKAIERGKSKTQIEAELFKRLNQRSIYDVMTPDEKQLLHSFPDMADALDADIRNAKSKQDILIAFGKARDNLTKGMWNDVMEQVKNVVVESAIKGKTERTQAALDAADNAVSRFTSQWLEHMMKMERVAAEVEKLTGAERAQAWRQAAIEQERFWSMYRNEEAATWLGIFKGLGAKDATPEYQFAVRRLGDLQDNLAFFYIRRKDGYDNYWNIVEGINRDKTLSKPEADLQKAAAWEAVNRDLITAYRDMVSAEDALQVDMDDAFARQYAAQMATPDAYAVAMNWRQAIQRVRRSTAQAMMLWREGAIPDRFIREWGDLLSPEQKKIIQRANMGQPAHQLDYRVREAGSKTFYKDVYQPLIANMLDASNRNAVGSRAPQPPPAPAAPARKKAKAQQPTQQAPAEPEPVQPPVVEVPAQPQTVQQPSRGIAPEAPPRVEQPKVSKSAVRKEVWRMLAEKQPDFDQMAPDAKLHLIKYIKKYSRQDAWIIGFDDITPDMVARAAANKIERDRMQGRLLGRHNTGKDAVLPDDAPEADRMKWLAYHDELTGARNKRALEDEVQRLIRAGEAHQIAMLDLRGLARTNTNIGYKIGDAYLKAVSDAMHEQGFTVYRRGGDEFVVIFDDADTAKAAMDKLKAQIDNSYVEVDHVTYEGARIHYGIGPDFDTASAAEIAARAADPNAAIYDRGTYQLRAIRSATERAASRINREIAAKRAEANPVPGAEGSGTGEAQPSRAPAEAAVQRASREASLNEAQRVVYDLGGKAVGFIESMKNGDDVLVLENGGILTPELLDAALGGSRQEIQDAVSFDLGNIVETLKVEDDYARDRIARTARNMIGDLPEPGFTAFDAEGNFITRQRGFAMPWYWDIYDRMKTQLEQIPNTKEFAAERKALKAEMAKMHDDYRKGLEWVADAIEQGKDPRPSRSERVNDKRREILRVVIGQALESDIGMAWRLGDMENAVRMLDEMRAFTEWDDADWNDSGFMPEDVEQAFNYWVEWQAANDMLQAGSNFDFYRTFSVEGGVEGITPAPRIPEEIEAQLAARIGERSREINATRAERIESNMQDPRFLPEPRKVGREVVAREMSEFFQNRYKDSAKGQDMAESYMQVWDAIGETWAKERGRTLNEFYEQVIIEYGGEGMGTEGLKQKFTPAPVNTHPWADIAKEHFGVTENIREAGYILPDGTLLDLSGRHYSSGYVKDGGEFRPERGQPDYLRNSRAVDHRELPDAITDSVDTTSNPHQALLKFMDETGAVRIDYNAGLINFNKPITNEQARILQYWFSDGWLEIDDPATGRPILNESFEGLGQRKMREFLARANETFTGKPDVLFQDAGRWYYSQLTAIVEQIPQERMTVAQLRGIISKEGAKADELKWTGLDDFIASRKDSDRITRTEVLDYLRDNQVELQEVTSKNRSGLGWLDTDNSFNDEMRRLHEERFNAATESEQWRLTAEIERVTREYHEGGKEPKYENYTLPGGTNYREMLLTLPEPRKREMSPLEAEYNRVVDVILQKVSNDPEVARLEKISNEKARAAEDMSLSRDERLLLRAERNEAEENLNKRWQEIAGQEIQERDVLFKQIEEMRGTAFQSPHWDEPNVLAHVRFDDRIDVDGKRVLFIEEIQSDWHQAGRERGYVDTNAEKILRNAEVEIRKRDKYNTNDYPTGRLLDYWFGYNDAPVKAISHRWLIGTPDEKITLILRGKDGNEFFAGDFKDYGEIASLFGDDLAKLAEQFETNYDTPKDNVYFEIPPDWSLRQAYDNARSSRVPSAPFSKTWPDLAMKRMIRYAAENGYDRVAWTTGKMQADRYNLAKQVDAIVWARHNDGTYEIGAILKENGREKSIAPNVAPDKLSDYVGKDVANKIISEPAEKMMGEYRGEEDLSVGGEGMRKFYDEMLVASTRKYIKKWGGDVRETVIYPDSSVGGKVVEFPGIKKNTVPAFDVTPAMRESAMRGQALFQDAGFPKGLTYWLDDGRAVIHAFNRGDFSTIVHETGHVFLTLLGQEDLRKVEGWLAKEHGIKELPDGWQYGAKEHVKAKETFARGFEQYLAEGRAPTSALVQVFEKFKGWLLDVYKRITGSEIDVRLTDEVRAVFDKWLGGEEAPASASAVNVSREINARKTMTPFERIMTPPLAETWRVRSPLEITRDNLFGVWDYYTVEIARNNPQVSPNRAGELAAARIAKAINEKIDEIESVRIPSKAEAEWADGILGDDFNYRQELMQYSGSRTLIEDIETEQIASRSLSALPLEDVFGERLRKSQELQQTAEKAKADLLEESRARQQRSESARLELESQKAERERIENIRTGWYQENTAIKRRRLAPGEAEEVIRKKLALGESVPPEVLADYPDLQAKPMVEAAQPAPALSANPIPENYIPVYRGTSKVGMTDIRPSAEGVYGSGTYFYTDAIQARSYAEPGGGIITGYVDPARVKIYPQEGKSYSVVVVDDMDAFIRRGDVPSEKTTGELYKSEARQEFDRVIRDALADQAAPLTPEPAPEPRVWTEQIGDFLYFKTAKGDLYRTAAGSPVDGIGYPMGGRWEAPAHLADQRIAMLKDTPAPEPAQRGFEKIRPFADKNAPLDAKGRITTDGRLYTVTGREIPMPNKIRLGSNRKIFNDMGKVNKWLVEQAILEAKSRGDDWNLMTFERANPAKLSKSDLDSMNYYLFGVEDVADLSPEAPPAPEPTLWDKPKGKPKQTTFFAQGEDTPLFSGTPETAKAETFAPQEAAPQDALFNMRDQLRGIEPKKAEGGAEGTALFGAEKAASEKPITVTRTYDAFKESKAPKEVAGMSANDEFIYAYGEEAWSDYSVVSDETGRKLRWVYVLSDGRRVSQDGVIRVLHPEQWETIRRYSPEKRAREGWKILNPEEKLSTLDAIDWNHVRSMIADSKDDYVTFSNAPFLFYLKEIGHPLGMFYDSGLHSSAQSIIRVMYNEKKTGKSVFDARPVDYVDAKIGTGENMMTDRLMALRYGLIDIDSIPRSKLEGLVQYYDNLTGNLKESTKDSWRGTMETVDRVRKYLAQQEPDFLYQMAPPEGNEAVGAPLGTADSISERPQQRATLEGLSRDVMPLLDQMQSRLLDQPGFQLTGNLDTAVPPEAMKGLRQYLGGVYTDLADTRMGAIRWGETRRDFSLLNYGRKTGFDTGFSAIFPYQFWYTRSMMNWALRALNRPSILAGYARLMRMASRKEEGDGYPQRLKGKIPIHLPFLPDWMGEYGYIDPYRQIYPFLQLARPFVELGEEKGIEIRKTESALYDMRDNEEITDTQLQEALQSRSGATWKKANAMARNEIEGDYRNPADFLFSMYGPSLPIGIAYQLLMGSPEKIGQLPITRTIQNATALLGIGGPRGLNIEGPIRKLTGLPAIDRWEDYRVDRELANMVADNLIDHKDATQAMIDRKGETFDEAQRRVSQQGLVRFGFGAVALDLFPEGEGEMRGLQQELKRAYEARDAGDEDALNKFWDKHPEYEARRMAMKEPEDRMRSFLIARVWEGYNDLEAAQRRQFRNVAGDVFDEAFLDSKSRAYGSISTDTLAMWANTVGQPSSDSTTDAQLPVDWLPDETSAAIQRYYDEKDKLFPYEEKQELNQWQQLYTKQEQYDPDFSKWQNAYLANNPEIVPYVVGENSKLYGLPAEIQQYVYLYRAAVDELFPSIYDKQEKYFTLTTNQRKTYRKNNPDLERFWNWRREMAAQFPQAAPYILSDQTLASSILGEDYNVSKDHIGLLSPEEMAQISPAVMKQLYLYAYRNEGLRPGGRAELQDLWESWGKPFGDLDDFIEMVIKPSITQGVITSQ